MNRSGKEFGKELVRKAKLFGNEVCSNSSSVNKSASRKTINRNKNNKRSLSFATVIFLWILYYVDSRSPVDCLLRFLVSIFLVTGVSVESWERRKKIIIGGIFDEIFFTCRGLNL